MNSPLPQDLASECRKAAKIIEAFVKPESNSVDSIIPPWVISNAKGVAILTVIKAGFLFSGRAGSGLVVARLEDGSWSAPSAIFTTGMGVGGQIGAELTDFVIILNTKDSVKAFSHGGNVTLGGNLSVAAGPIGRNAEAGGTVGNFAAIFSYSKTRGLFAGVSIEGTVILERKDANANFYHRKVSAKEILSGSIPPPPSSEDLYRALNRRVETGAMYTKEDGGKFGRRPTYRERDERDDYEDSDYRRENHSRSSTFDRKESTYNRDVGRDREKDNYRNRDETDNRRDTYSRSNNSSYSKSDDNIYSRDTTIPSRPSMKPRPPPPPRPAEKPTVVALYDFDAERDTDLWFKKGDIIVVTKRTDSQDDWWEGSCNGRKGQFPANYVQA